MTTLTNLDVADPRDAMRDAVRGVLDDFSRRVLEAHSYSEVEAHRDELAELILVIMSRAEDPEAA